MWLSRLDLLAFGHFSNVRLDLGPGFHLVYGPNEAGKSTALRAIRQLLFGFDERTTDNFLHKNPNLRIGGLLSTSSGLDLEIIRRKTRKESLRQADDTTVVDESQWQQMLAGIDETTFARRYGINYEQLIEGGREIATGSGDLGEILFATASGVKDLSTVQKSLNDEAAELFRQKGEKQRINAALKDLKSQRDLISEKLVLVTEWEEIDRERQKALSQLDLVSKRCEECKSQLDQLESWKLAWPHVQDQESIKQELAEYDRLPRLPENFGALRKEASTILDQANVQERMGAVDLSRAQAILESIEIPEALLEGADELTRLLTEWGSYSKAQLDRKGLLEQLNRLNDSSKDLYKKLERPIDDSALDEFVLDRSHREKVGHLGRQQAGLIQSLQQAKQQQLRLRQKIDELQADLVAIPVVQPLNDLQQVVRHARNDGDLEAQRSRVIEEIRMGQSDVNRQLNQIGLWTGTLAELKTITIPPVAVIKEFETQFDTNQSEQTLLRLRLSELENRHRKLIQQIDILQSQFRVPTEAEMNLAREQRDLLWAEIREVLSTESRPTTELIESFHNAMLDADRIADRLRNEADRVAQLADQLSDQSANETLQQEAMLRLAELESLRFDVEKNWAAAWPDLNIAPLPPREMRTWLERRENLLRCDSRLACRKDDASAITERIVAHLAALDLHIGPTTPVSHLDQRLEAAEDLLKRNAMHQHRREDTEERLATLKNEEQELVGVAERTTRELMSWQGTWGTAMTDLMLPPDTSVESAYSFLETLGELADVQKQTAHLAGRISDIDRDAAEFRLKVKSLCEQWAPELVESTTDDAVNSLRTQLSNSQRDRATLQEQLARKEQAEKRIDQAREARVRGKSQLTELHLLAGLNSEEIESTDCLSESSLAVVIGSLTDTEEKSRLRIALEEKRNRSIERLQGLARAQPVDDFIHQVLQQSRDHIINRVQQLEAEIPGLVDQQTALVNRIAEIQAELKRMDGRSDAAEAEEKQQSTLAQIRSDSEQYVRAKLAGAILHSAIEKYREKSRGPVLTAASELFRELTLGGFDGLRVDEDDRGNPVLVGVRSESREAVHVEGMSEGTCDQLYLALRLASLGIETAPRNQLPFIVDDILIQFDDERAAAALQILARLSTQRQIIFFTHHEHLLEIAEKNLAGEFTPHRIDG